MLCSLSACRAFESVSLLADAAASIGPGGVIQDPLPPARNVEQFTAEGEIYQAHLYLPRERADAAVVLVPGAAPEGLNDPRLVAFATMLTRARFAVLVPDLPNVRALQVSADDARGIAGAIRHLAERSGNAHARSIGVVAVSYAAGPAMIATLRPEAHPFVRYVVAVGGYYDVEAAINFLITGFYRERPGRPWLFIEPNRYARWVFLRGNASRLNDPGEAARLQLIAAAKLDDPAAPTDALAAELGPEGRAVHALLTNRDPEQTPALIAALPGAMREQIRGLDLRTRDLTRFPGRLILVHGRNDNMVPYTESAALAGALPPGKAALYLLDGLSHVDPGKPGFADIVTLAGAVSALLRERDQGMRPRFTGL